ncbi:MAG: TonB-dependent receptor [Dysgonamonadaceae bacterium]|jgi:outer membrane cobalamin receptor|nr:TonB-dependent receptor [Dysgonamonadaceae bacterium]
MAKKIYFLMCCMLCISFAIHAQVSVKGTILDKDTKEPLIGVTVYEPTSKKSAITDLDGTFNLKLPSIEDRKVELTYIGYLKQELAVSADMGTILLVSDAVVLGDVVVTASIAIQRKTPVAMSTIDPEQIEYKLGTKEYPEILKSTPSVYATKEGGGFGDSNVRIRGFKSENVAVMINGVPMNDMEWGGVYWSNWAGLPDVTRSMQVQRGLGASKVSAPSVGGSINIVTRSIDAKKGGVASYGIGNDGYNKALFSISSGLLDNGWALTLLGSKTWGEGYIQGTEFESYNYFINIAKRLNENHQLSLTALGAPQVHNQRNSNDGLSIQGWQEVKKYMQPGEEYRYNPTYGFGKNGERKTSSKNKYHKPQISLNHIWQVSETSSLSTALYLSIGDGWGYSGQGTNSTYGSQWYGSSSGTLNTTFRNADGTFAYDKIQDMNENSENGSQMVMSVSKNQHRWWGLLSTYTGKLTENIDFYAGVDGRYYIGIHTNEIIDLYNGEYYIDSRNRPTVKPENNKAALDPNWINQKLTVGDIVYRDYNGYVLQEGVFGQIEYNKDKLSAFVAGSLNNTSQWRYDRFYYDAEHAKSETVSKIGFTAKGGANYNLTDNHNVFANIGYISRAPFFSGGAFLSVATSNVTNPNAVNEKIFSIEGGYGFRSQYLSANLNLYHTQWKDKTMAKSQDVTLSDDTPDRAIINMQGVNSIHQGIELNFLAKPLRMLEVTGMFSIGDWKWTNNPIGYYYNSNGQPFTKNYEIASAPQAEDHASSKLLLDGVKEGGSAQITAALGAIIRLGHGIRAGIDWNYYGHNYADWALTPSSDLVIGGEKAFSTPWIIPASNTFDLNVSYTFNMGTFNTTLSGNIDNLFDQLFITQAYDGSNHDWQSAYRVFYGFGRTMSMRLKIHF